MNFKRALNKEQTTCINGIFVLFVFLSHFGQYETMPWNNLEYIKLDRDKSTFKSHRDFSSEKEISFKHF